MTRLVLRVGALLTLALSLGAQETPPVESPTGQEESGSQGGRDDPATEDGSQETPPQTPPQTPPGEGAGEQQDSEKTPPPEPTKEQEPPGPIVEPPAPAEDAPRDDGARKVEPAAPAPVAEAPAVPPVAPPRVAVTYPASADDIDRALRALSEAHPEATALEVLGRSVSGREILALSVRLEGPVPVAERPVLLVVDHQGPPSPAAEALVGLAAALLARSATEPALAGLLGRTVLVLAPALDPDVRVASAPARAVRFERNFPSGWQPASVRRGAGSISLSEPETLATARFLTARGGAAVLLGFAAPAPARPPYAGAELPESDREVLARLVGALELPGRPPVIPWNEMGSPGGSPFDYAYQACGILSLALPLEPSEERSPEALAAWNAEVEERVVTCLSLLPQLGLTQEGLERLAADTWQLDLALANTGLVPTLSARGRARAPGADVTLEVSGAKLLASAQRGPSEVSYQDASFPAGGRTTLSAGTLAGGDRRLLRLVLEGASGSEVRVIARSPWGGSASVTLTLP